MNTPMLIGASRPSFSSRAIAFGARWMLGMGMFRNGVARSFFQSSSLQANPDYGVAFHTMLKTAKAPILAAAIRSVLLRGEPLKPRMASLSMPTLIIAGEQDAMYPLSVQADAARLAPKAHFEVVPGKHISAIDAPEHVSEHMLKFIAASM